MHVPRKLAARLAFTGAAARALQKRPEGRSSSTLNVEDKESHMNSIIYLVGLVVVVVAIVSFVF